MTQKIVSIILIYTFLPFLALFLFLRFKSAMRYAQVVQPPLAETFLLLLNYMVLAMVTLTTLSWGWYGITSLDTFYLFIAAPVVCGAIAWRQFKNQTLSVYHKNVVRIAFLFFIIAPLILLILFLTGRIA